MSCGMLSGVVLCRGEMSYVTSFVCVYVSVPGMFVTSDGRTRIIVFVVFVLLVLVPCI
jgi:hypothetical protein